MGSSHPINQTLLGRSLIGKRFMTKDHVCFFCGHDKKYGVMEWKDKQYLGIAGVNSINLEIQSNIKFEIIDVSITTNKGGSYVGIMIKILNNIPIKDIGKIVEFNPNYQPGSISQLDRATLIAQENMPTIWIYRDNLGEVRSNMLPYFTQYDLNIADIEGILYDFEFGFEFQKSPIGDIDTNSPYILQGDKLTEI